MSRAPLARALTALGLATLGLPGCGAPATRPAASVPQYNTAYVPDFATRPYQPFSREDVVAIALREWRLFGQPVDDDPPDTRPPPAPEQKPERWPGLWQRVGEYWWFGMNPDTPDRDWTGKHDATGAVFPASQDGDFAWSAAFISYVMRIGGAGERFPYAASHSTYINAAAAAAQSGSDPWVIAAERVDAYPPRQGDVICTGRPPTPHLRFDMLPRQGGFASHCDIVVAAQPGQLSVIGGNVDDAVTMKHIPITSQGLLAPPGAQVLDPRYEWFVVLRVLYDTDTDPVAAARLPLVASVTP